MDEEMMASKKNIMINRKKMTTDEALKVLADKKTKVTELSMTFDKTSSGVKEETPLTHIGFPLEQDFVSSISKTMTKNNAARATFKFTKSPHIMGRDFTIIMEDPRPEPGRFVALLHRLGHWLVDL